MPHSVGCQVASAARMQLQATKIEDQPLNIVLILRAHLAVHVALLGQVQHRAGHQGVVGVQDVVQGALEVLAQVGELHGRSAGWQGLAVATLLLKAPVASAQHGPPLAAMGKDA